MTGVDDSIYKHSGEAGERDMTFSQHNQHSTDSISVYRDYYPGMQS